MADTAYEELMQQALEDEIEGRAGYPTGRSSLQDLYERLSTAEMKVIGVAAPKGKIGARYAIPRPSLMAGDTVPIAGGILPASILPASILPVGGVGELGGPGSLVGDITQWLGGGAYPQAGQELVTEIPGQPIIQQANIGAITGAAGAFTLGTLKALLTRYGPTILKSLVGAGVFAGFMKLLGIGASDDTIVKAPHKKRYSIGNNPRVRTLAKVSRHCARMLKRHEKVIREFLPKKTVKYGVQPAAYLSAIERKAIKS